jgi:lysophospholipase L1-like esterase
MMRILALLLAVLLVSCSGDVDSVVDQYSQDSTTDSGHIEVDAEDTAAPAPQVIVALGDSLTEGVCCDLPWPEQIGVINSGVGSTWTNDAMARLDTDVLAYAPDLVILWLGAAQMAQWGDLAQFEAGLEMVASEIQASGAAVLLVDMLPLCLEYDVLPRYLVDPEPYSAAIHAVASDTGALLLTWESWPDDSCPALYGDWIHPNQAGHDRIAEIVGTYLEQEFSWTH